jgi:predicted transcriptional regulator
MDEMVHKSVHDAIIAIELGKTYERLDRRLSDIVDKLAALETRCWRLPTSPSMTPADANLGWQYFMNHE